MTHIEAANISSKQNPRDILVVLAIIGAIFGFFSILFI